MRLVALLLASAVCAAADPEMALIDYQLQGRIGMALQVSEFVDTSFRLQDHTGSWDDAWRVGLDASYHHPVSPRRALIAGGTVFWEERDGRAADVDVDANALGLNWHVGALLSAYPHGSVASWNVALQPRVHVGVLWQDVLLADPSPTPLAEVHPQRYEAGAGVDLHLFVGRWLNLQAGVGAQAWISNEQGRDGTATSRFRGSDLWLRGGLGVTF